MNTKKSIAILLSGILAISLVGCSNKPSTEKIKAALHDGTITMEDAKSKGWIDDEWIKANFEIIEGESKIYMFDKFETTYLDGSKASSDIISGSVCLVFFNTQNPDTIKKLQVFNEISDELKTIGTPIIGIITDSDTDISKEKLADIKFPIMVYNDEMKKSLKRFDEMINDDLVSVFTKDGGFYTAWYSDVDAKKIVESAQKLVNDDE